MGAGSERFQSFWQRYLSEFEVESLTEGLSAEVPEAFIRWVDPGETFQQEANRLHHFCHYEVHCHGHVDLLI